MLRPPGRRTGWTRAFASLTIPDFRMLWFGMLFSMAAMQMDIVSRSWLAYEISGSGLALGLVAFARGVPMLLFSLLGGVAADRLDKRKMLLLTQGSLGILALANGVLVHLGIVQVWHLVVIGFLQGAVFSFNMPARQAYIPELVGEGSLANALAVHSTGMNANRTLAPAIAGLLITWHPTIAFYAIAALYVGAVLPLLRLPPGRTAAGKMGPAVAEVLSGFRYISGQPALRVLIGMALIPVLLGMPFQQLLPVFQADVLHVGPAQLGLMYTAAGVGSLIGSLLVAYLSEYPRKGLLQVIAGIGFGASLLVFAVSSTYGVSVALLVLVGLASQGYMTLNNVLIMLETDKKLYGRVMSIYMITWSVMPLATLPMGALVDLVGVQATVAGAGALLAALIAVIAVRHPAGWRVPAVHAR